MIQFNQILKSKIANFEISKALRFLIGFLFFQIYLFLPSAAEAGTVQGAVTNACSGLPVAAANISIKSGLSEIASGITNKDGNYSITDADILGLNMYSVQVSRSGYDSQSKSVLILKSGTAAADFELVPTGMAAPSVTTNPADTGYSDKAYLNATINPNGAETEYYFQYGLTTAYGITTALKSAGSGTADVLIGPVLVQSLLPATTYHYRIFASNCLGTSFGSDLSFTTDAVPPTVNTNAATAITGVSATLNGTVNPNNSSTNYYYQYGTTISYGDTTTEYGPLTGTATQSVPVPVSGLNYATTYHYRIVAFNAAGTVYGDDQTFTTLTPPTVTTEPADSITNVAAALNAVVNPNGSDTTCYFEYGLSTSYGLVSVNVDIGSGNAGVPVMSLINGLDPVTLYNYRIVATNAGGASYGENQSFTTHGTPGAKTGSPTNVTGTSVTLNGIVNPQGSPTVCYFEYGLTTDYGHVTASLNAGTEATQVDIALDVVQLTPNTDYHFRLVAENEYGITLGDDANFSTLKTPTVVTGSTTEVLNTQATIAGMVNPNGIAVSFYFEYGTDTNYGQTTDILGSGSGTSDLELSKTINGLSPDTVYHYRLVADDGEELFYGADGSFLTSQESYRFERMWPTLQQPWYFDHPEGVAVDNAGFVYVADRVNNCIHKFTLDGHFVAKWGRSDGNAGTADGEFNSPVGVAVDSKGFVYVADKLNSRIQKFTRDGEHIVSWGDHDQLGFVNDVAVDGSGCVYVTGSNNFVWKFICRHQKDGTWDCSTDFVQWGGLGTDDGQFNGPMGIAVDPRRGVVYVTDRENDRVQKFTTDGDHLLTWGGGDLVYDPWAVTVDAYGFVYVTEYLGNRIQKFTPDGGLVETLVEGYGYGTGELFRPQAVVVDRRGYMYVADTNNNRIQIFDAKGGKYLNKWASNGSEAGYFKDPFDIAVEMNGTVYVADGDNFRIQKFSSEGEYLAEWGTAGSGPGEFGGSSGPQSMAVDDNGHVYALDRYNGRIQKFTNSGGYLTSIQDFSGSTLGTVIAADLSGNVYVTSDVKDGEESLGYIQKFRPKTDGSGDYEFAGEWPTEQLGYDCLPVALAIDNNTNLLYVLSYVGPDLPYTNYMVQAFTLDGTLVKQWQQSIIDGDGYSGLDIAVDGNGFVYVVDKKGCHISKYTSAGYHLIAEWFYEKGVFPHQLRNPFLDVDADGDMFVVDRFNNRVQKFIQYTFAPKAKAIVVAGGGPFQGNNLWDATRMCTHFAYRTLSYQGYTKEDIYYLTSDTQVDMDGNGLLDDVDGDATNDNLYNAITSWATDTESLVVYLADHGGESTFRMSSTETLSAENLNNWLNELQQVMSGRVIVVYEACDSGSFMQTLAAGENRLVITSTSMGESAYFMTQGSVSFSNFFWTQIFNGDDIQDAFVNARDAIGEAADFQHPLMDADGDGMDDAGDGYSAADGIFIGSGTDAFENAPLIGSVVPDDIINGTSSAELYAEDVTDPDGVARVWAIIRPPGFSQGSPDNPIQALPSIDLLPVEGNRYEATYDEFFLNGTYQIAIYARDRIGNTSLPAITTISVNEAITRKAIIIASSKRTNPALDPLWPAVETCADLAYTALTFQGYTDDDIYFLSPVSFLPGIDALPTLSNIEFALNTWAQDQTQDVVLYLIGHSRFEAFQVNETEVLTPEAFDTLLDNLQAVIPGTAAVIVDAGYSGGFITKLTPEEDRQRILIAAAGSVEKTHFLAGGTVSFSHTFWNKVLNGVNVRDAFLAAKNVTEYALEDQHPLLDDNGNGLGNESSDGEVARYHSIGMGILLSGNAPQSGEVSADVVLENGETSAEIWIDNVTTTGSVTTVFAVITPPSALPGLPGDPTTNLPRITLADDGTGRYAGTYDEFNIYGLHEVAVFAQDADGNLSEPKITTVFQSTGPDVFEADGGSATANVIVLDHAAQTHNFHIYDDQDWVMFYGIAGEAYDVVTTNRGADCDTTITILDVNGEHTSNNLLSWTCPGDGLYYVKIVHSGQVTFGPETRYDLSIDHMAGGIPGDLVGRVTDAAADGIGGAVVRSNIGNCSTISYPNGYYIMVLPSGTHTISSTADGYEPWNLSGVQVLSENYANQDITLSPLAASDKGNINGDGLIDLADAIVALKVLSNLDVYGQIRMDYASTEADVNGDDKIGVAEAIYVLQSISGLR